MTADYRAMCAELVDELEDWIAYGDALAIEKAHNLVDRARALLAQHETSNLAEVRSSLGDHQPLVEDDVDLYLEQ